MDFFRNLIPPLALPYTRTQFPATALGDRVQFRSQPAEAVGNPIPRLETRQPQSECLGSLGHDSDRSPQPPIGSAELGDVLVVDPKVVVAELMVGEYRAEIEVILFVRFDHLQLHQCQLGESKG